MANGTVMPATGNGGGFGNILRSTLPAALLGIGAGASIRRGNITPLLSAGTGYLSGMDEREQREAEALAEEEKRRQAARKAKLEEQKLRQSLQPEFRFSRGGFTGLFTPEAVPPSVFGQPLKPEAREREEKDRLEKGFSMLESAFNELPVERFSRPFQSGGAFFQQSPETGEIEEVFRPEPEPFDLATDPTNLRAIAREQRARARGGGRGDGRATTADLREQASSALREEFPHIRPQAGGYPAGLWDSLRAWVGQQFPRLSSGEKNAAVNEFVGPRPKAEEDEGGVLTDAQKGALPSDTGRASEISDARAAVQQAQRAGTSDAVIRQNLVDAGFTGDEIRQIMRR